MKICIQSLIIVLVFSISTSHAIGLTSDYPDIKPVDISIKDKLVEGEEVNVTVYIKNVGASFSQNFSVALFVDDNLVDIKIVYDGIREEISKKVVFMQTFTLGKHYIRVVSDYYNEIKEKDEYNNEMIKLVYVEETKPDISIENLDGFPDILQDGDTIRAKLTLRNLGHEIDKDFYVSVKVGDIEKEMLVRENLSLGESYMLFFNLTVGGFGYKYVQILADSKKEIEESNTSNNLWKKEIFIYKFLPWYNETFHYRFLVTTEKGGKASLKLNFSEILNKLNLNAKFDVDSIRVIEYDSSGKIKNKNVKFFLENITNGGCDLMWLADDNRYYMIYFDVLENGKKERIISKFNETRNASIKDTFDPEGWKIYIENPKDGSTFPENHSLDIDVYSLALIDEVIVYVFKEDNCVTSSILQTDDWINYSGELNLEEGDYILRFVSTDKAGYMRENTVDLHVGKIDLWIDNVFVEGRIYEDITSLLKIKIKSSIPVKKLPIEVDVELIYKNISYLDVHNLTLDGSSSTFNIPIVPKLSGKAIVNISVYPSNKVNDRNLSNNFFSINITISKPTDVLIRSLFMPEIIEEGATLTVHVLLENRGDEEIEAEASLYLSKTTISWSSKEREDSKEIKLHPDTVINISLTWKDSRYGSWIVGIEVRPDTTDSNISNNRKVKILDVRKGERNPPKLIDFWCRPQRDEVGRPINIYAQLLDDTGIDEVTLVMIHPDGRKKNISMLNLDGLWFHEFRSSSPGRYECYIVAKDSSPVHNTLESERIRFELDQDNTPPTIEGVWINPKEKQLVNKTVEIGCKAFDNIGIRKANITIIHPDGKLSKMDMKGEDNRYVLRIPFDEIGQYLFFITVVDERDNKRQSDLYNFWITEDLNDTDSDGLPDWWEKMYGLDPKNPKDSEGDIDGDGIIEIREYAEGLSPIKSNTLWGLSQYEIAIVVAFSIVLILLATLAIERR